MTTGYEVKMFADISNAARALKEISATLVRVADALEVLAAKAEQEEKT
jgi:hypothetical protein